MKFLFYKRSNINQKYYVNFDLSFLNKEGGLERKMKFLFYKRSNINQKYYVNFDLSFLY